MDRTMSRRGHCFTYNRLYSVPFAYVLVSMTDCHMDKGHYESCDIAVNQLRIINLFTALRPPPGLTIHCVVTKIVARLDLSNAAVKKMLKCNKCELLGTGFQVIDTIS